MKSRTVCLIFSLLVLLIHINACKSSEELNFARYYANGQNLYKQHCQNCHSPAGKGLAALIPPLTDTLFLKKNRNRLSCIIKNGLAGKIIINQKVFNEQMPANSRLADIEIAELITYITNSFGNKQGILTAAEATEQLNKCTNVTSDSTNP